MSTKDAADKNQASFIMKIASRIAGSFVEAMPGMANAAYGAAVLLFPKVREDAWSGFANDLVAKGLVDQATADRLKPLSLYPFPWGNILPMLAILQVKMADLKSIMEIYSLDKQYDIMAQVTPHPAPVDALVRSMIIDPGRATENRVELKKHGYSELQIDNIILAHYRTVDEGTLRTQYLRGIIDESRLYERMRELGYTDQRTSEIVQTWVLLPGPQDLFAMVAKEAFEPDMYIPLGLAEEFPTEQLQHLEKQGISRGWAEKYWIAHWDQPSIGQGFEMLHRGVIDNETLDLLFRAIEIPSFWRDKLTKIAYNPYTRVDTRRMHDLGVLTDEELIRSYMDQGYDSEKALKMANFTIRFNLEHEQQLTRSAIMESFREDLITRSESVMLLTEQGYSDILIDYYLELEEFSRDKKIRDQKIDNIRERYLLSQITVSAARDQLNQLDLRGEKVDSLIETWTLDAYKYETIPSKSDLDNFLIKGIITEGRYRDYMARYGFTPLMIDWYLQSIEGDRVFQGRRPTKADLGNWYKRNTIDETQYRAEMTGLGYATKYVDYYFKSL